MANPSNVSPRQLQQIPLFAKLDQRDLKAVADIAQQEHYSVGQFVYHQGERGQGAYLVESGELRIRRVDPEGFEREVTRLGPGSFLGETSLLLGELHDATLEATQESSLIFFSREAFEELLEDRPRMLKALEMRPEVEEKRQAPRFDWQSPDEVVIISLHKHDITLISKLIFPTLLFLLVLAGLGHTYLQDRPILILIPGGMLAFGLLLFNLYLIIDHFNDNYILTTKRVVHEEREFLIRESRAEAPLRNIQNIQQVQEGILAQVFDFGDLIIETAGEHGVVIFRRVAHPKDVQNEILNQSRRVEAWVRAEERAAVRDALRRRFSEAPPEEEDLQEETTSSPKRRLFPSWLLAPFRIFRYFFPPLSYQEGNTVTWRKHWIALIRPITLPSILIVGSTLITTLLIFPGDNTRNIAPILIGYGLIMAFLSPWWLWVFENWKNDIYRVTSTRIIDIEQKPFGLREDRREASLGAIQNINLKIPGIVGRLFRYGSVTIETAGIEPFTFALVRNPREVQKEIFRRLEDFEERQRRREARRRQNELLDWFSVYDQMRNPTAQQGSLGTLQGPSKTEGV